jgi:hypothetical protein
LIVTFRPEFEAPWVGQPHVTALTAARQILRENPHADLPAELTALLGP